MANSEFNGLSEEERKRLFQKFLNENRYNTYNKDNNNLLPTMDKAQTENKVQKENNTQQDNRDIWKKYNSTGNMQSQGILPTAQKNNSVFQDIVGVVKNVIAGASSGIKQIGNYIENANEQNVPNYKDTKANQFLTSKKVDELDKATLKSQDEFKNNVLLKDSAKTSEDDRIEANLVKKVIQDSIQEDNKKIEIEQEKMSNGVTKKLGELAPSIGQMGTGMVANVVNPALGASYFFTSAGGGYIDEAKQRGMTDKQAFQFGTIMGGMESATELVGLENFKKAGIGLKSLIARGKSAGKEVAKTSLKTVLKNYGIGVADNFIQEALIDPIQEVVASQIGGKDKANWENMPQQMLQDGINGALVAMITGGIGLGIKSCTSVAEKINSGKKVSQSEYKQAITDAQKGGVNLEDCFKTGTNQSVYKNTILNNLNTSNLSDKTKTELQQYLKENQITEEQYNQINETLQQEKMSKEEQSSVSDNEMKYQYIKSDNAKVNQLRQDVVNNNWDNSKETNNFVNFLEKIVTDKDVEIRLDANLKDNEGNVANGSYKDGVITINPNSDRSGEFLAVHELTHAIGTDEMRNMIQKYRESNSEFNNAVEKLLGTYKASELNDEALADISGQLFSSQDFINNVSNTNPSFFRKIYNEIKYLWHQFRGYKNQNQFVDDLYYKWTEAYNSNNKLNDTTNYHISENFSDEIDKALKNELPSNTQVKARDFTPKILVDSGVQDLPMLITQKHIKSTIYTQQEAQALGLQTKNVNYHGLGKELLIKAIDNLDSPQAIYKTSENNYLVVTEFKDNNGKEIIVPIQINGNGRYNDVFIDENQIKSVYGRNNLDNYINKNNFEQIYKKNKELDFNEGIQYSNVANSSIENSIASQDEDVNTTTKYSKQESENNSGSFNLSNNNIQDKKSSNKSSFSIEDINSNVDKLNSDSKNKTINKLTKEGITMTYVHMKNQNTQYYGSTYGQNIEPSGEYMSMDIYQGKYKVPNADYGTIHFDNPLILDHISTGENGWKKTLSEMYGGKTGKKLSNAIMESGHDAIITIDEDGNYNEIVNLNGKKDNNVKYSKENSTWRDYLESHFQSTGTRTDMSKLPIDNKIIENRKQQIINKAQQIEKTNPDFQGLADEIKNNYLGKDFDYNTYKQMNEYLDSLKPVEKGNNPTRHEVIQKNRELARENIENIRNWKDKSNGLKYQLETMERNMYDIIPDKEEAKKMIDTYFEPIHKSEAEKQKFINKYNDKIKDLNLNKYEAEAVQLLGEQKYNPSFKADEVKDVIDRVNKNIENKKIDSQKVDKAIDTFRNIYDELFELENKTLKENGYKEKPYRKGYFPHFIDYVPETKSEKILNALGFKIDKRPLPTDIAGITEQFVPGKTWNKSALERKTNKTDYNALKGFDTYISQASDNIFHIENIQKLRALENEIRYQYSDKGVQERIDNILNDETLYEEEKQQQINAIFDQIENPMPNLVTELRRYTNALANKKSEADRSAESKYGRSIYNTISAIENRFGANAVGLNIGSAVTNFIPITQAWSQVSTKNMGRATIDTIKSFMTDDNFVDQSVFLTSRLRQSEKLYKTSLDKISDKTSFLFNTVDEVSSNIVVRGKYLENIEKGMSEAEAIKNADQFARNVIADRSKGALPTKFEEKNPVTKMLTQFQLEVNNQYRYMFKDIPRDLADEGLGAIAKAFFKMFIGAYIYNWASEKITGRKPAFSPLDIAVSTYKNFADSNKKTFDKLSDTATEIGEQLPFVGSLIGGGRVPVNGAIPNVANVTKGVTGLVTGEMDSSKAKDTITKELTKPLYYLLPPFGGAQIKKSVEGISTVANGGSYGVDNKGNETLQIPVEDKSVKNYVKAGLFGKYALPEAKEYTEREYKSLNANQTKIYKESNLPYKQLLDYIDQKLKKDKDKINYLKTQDMTTEQKWGIYKYDLISNNKRSDGGTQLSDAEYMINNGVSKKEYMDAFDKAVKYNIDLPTKDEYIKMKQSGLKLSIYIDYKTKLYNDNVERKINNFQKAIDKDAEFDTETKESLKTKDKIRVLQNAQYTNKEKKAIYSNYIDKDDKNYSILNNTSNFDIDNYLDYKQQKFESDKKDDGTIKGKSISGSAKNKFYNYMDDSNFTYEQKLLLTGMKYKTTNAERENIFNIINNFELSSKEKLKIMSKMQGFKVYNNGQVSF